MTTPSAPTQPDADALAARGARRLTRGITATWWYTASAILFFELALTLVWIGALVNAGVGDLQIAIILGGGLIWSLSTVPLLLEYRHRDDESPLTRWQVALGPFLIAIAFGIAAGLASGLWVIGLLPVVQAIMLLNWQPGVRLRVVVAGTVLLMAAWIIDLQFLTMDEAMPDGYNGWTFLAVYTILLPPMSVISLWWWDVLITLDRARASEARLAATQERLRLATDVHDLQGHHLQVIALQLELAERLILRDPEAALLQLRASRTSVDEARQGTRDLATRFRSVPLRDELANAADLLRAAGTRTEVTVDPQAEQAPADILGPVIRETTTNMLRHGGGSWARLSLARVDGVWRYEASNDVNAQAVATGDGSGTGLDGLRRRASEAAGTLTVSNDGGIFTVVMDVPEHVAGSR